MTSPGRPEEGRHPLPTADELSTTARRWGLHDGDRVVVYDDNDGVRPRARGGCCAVTASRHDDAALAPERGVLIDVRAPRYYRGLTDGLDPASGHIPGAVNIPTVSHIAPSGLLRTPDEIAATLAGHGIGAGTEVVVYCSSGIPSAHSVLAFATVGVEARVFAGSWSQCSRSPGRPIARGPEPAGLISVV